MLAIVLHQWHWCFLVSLLGCLPFFPFLVFFVKTIPHRAVSTTQAAPLVAACEYIYLPWWLSVFWLMVFRCMLLLSLSPPIGSSPCLHKMHWIFILDIVSQSQVMSVMNFLPVFSFFLWSAIIFAYSHTRNVPGNGTQKFSAGHQKVLLILMSAKNVSCSRPNLQI